MNETNSYLHLSMVKDLNHRAKMNHFLLKGQMLHFLLKSFYFGFLFSVYMSIICVKTAHVRMIIAEIDSF